MQDYFRITLIAQPKNDSPFSRAGKSEAIEERQDDGGGSLSEANLGMLADLRNQEKQAVRKYSGQRWELLSGQHLKRDTIFTKPITCGSSNPPSGTPDTEAGVPGPPIHRGRNTLIPDSAQSVGKLQC